LEDKNEAAKSSLIFYINGVKNEFIKNKNVNFLYKINYKEGDHILA